MTIGLGPLSRPLRFIRRQLPPVNFITIHYAYFILTCLISAIIFWGSSTPARSVSFTDSLFLTVSAMTLAGLNTVNLSTLNTFQQFLLFLLIMLGSAIFVSAFVVQVRKSAFERKFKDVEEMQRQGRGRSRSRSRSRGQTWSLRRRSVDVSADAEGGQVGTTKNGDSMKTGDDSLADARVPHSPLDGARDEEDRDPTPPARRGGPEMNRTLSGMGRTDSNAISDSEFEMQQSPNRANPQGITFRGDTRFNGNNIYQHHLLSSAPKSQQRRRSSGSIFNMQGVGARPHSSLVPTSPVRSASEKTRFGALDGTDSVKITPPVKGQGNIGQYFESVGGWIARNSQFHGLTEKEREQLGGYEYRAVSLLAWLVPVYFVLWQLLGCIGCAAWVAINRPNSARTNGLNPWWVGAFNAVSAFNNSGMSLLDANMTAYQTGDYLLITMGLLILAGNTCYPIFLRLIVWCMWKIVASPHFHGPQWDERARTLRFLLDHPRRCYTNLFPSQHTWWLLMSVVTLNGIDWAAFEILNIHNSALDGPLPTNVRVIDGLFQALAVRSGGFYVVAIASLRISLQVLYVVMMYISVYPVVITMRNSNVYEERSLGIYAEDQEDEENVASNKKSQSTSSGSEAGPGLLARAITFRDHFVAGGAATKESNGHFVRQQLRAQLAHDAWWIVLALFLVMIIENTQFDNNPAVFSVFNFIFEVVSAYGCVGISVGVPWAAYSFCGSWHTLSKLILCAVMLRGRHRGLPVAIDKAVLLPGEASAQAEEDDGRIRMARTMSRGRQEFV